MFRPKIPYNGPNNLLNVFLSIQTNLHGVVALMLACLTVSFIKAIYPKYSPALYSKTFFTGSFPSFFSAINCPSAII